MLVGKKNWVYQILIVSLFFVLFSSTVQPQDNQYRFKHLTSNDGLSQNRVYAIHQDRTGFMWFGTYDGLNRYDGYNFKIFHNDPFDTTTITDNEVKVIYEDKAGNLWIGAGGLNRFDPVTESFQRFLHDPGNPNSLSDNNILTICEDQNGILWIGTKNEGLNRLEFPAKNENLKSTDIDTGINYKEYNYLDPVFTQFKHNPDNPKSLSHNMVHSVLVDTDDILWIGTERGLNGIDLKQNNTVEKIKESGFIRYTIKSGNSLKSQDKAITSLYMDSKGIIWIGTSYGLIKHINDIQKTGLFIYYPLNKDQISADNLGKINSILEMSESELWLGTQQGIAIFNRLTGQYHFLKHDRNNPESISSNNQISLFNDHGGVTWVGTGGNGIDKINTKRKAFQYYSCPTTDHKMLSTRTIMQDRTGLLWVVDSGGKLYHLNYGDSKLIRFVFNDSFDGYIYDLIEDHTGLIWFGIDNRLCRFNPTNKQKKYYMMDPNYQKSADDYCVLKVLEDKNKNIWVVTFKTLSRFDRRKHTFIHYPLPNEKRSIIYSVYPDSEDMFWFATEDGLWRFRLQDKTWHIYHNDPKNPNSLSQNTIFSIFPDPRESNRYLWLGTAGGGLNRFDKKTEEFIMYCEHNGLPNNVVYGILADQQDNLWLSTNQGLSRFNPRKKTFRNYNYHDGLQSNEFNSQSYFKSQSGEMFFGGINGITAFYPENITDNLYVPPIIFNEFKLFHKSVSFKSADSPLRKPVYQTSEITVSYDQNNLGFEFTALDFTAPANNCYAYKMDNIDTDWIHAGTKHEAYYSNLPPGEYVFYVKGSNNDGIWNEEGTSLKIIVTPPFWKTWWAYLLYVVLIGTTLYITRQYDMHRIQLRNQLEYEKLEIKKCKELDQLKSGFFTGISHEFRTPLTLIIGPVEQLMLEAEKGKKWETLSVVKRNALHLLRLINQLLDLSRSEAGEMKLNIAPGNIIEFLRRSTMQFASLAESKNISLQFSAIEENLELYFDREIIEKVLVNLLSNAIKFTPREGSVTVAVSSNSDKSSKKSRQPLTSAPTHFIEIKVSDTGIGIPEDSLPYILDRFYQVETAGRYKGSGIGMAIVKDFVELHHGSISVESEEGCCTTFTVLLPMGREHFSEEELSRDSFLLKSDMDPEIYTAIGEEVTFPAGNHSETPEYSDILDHSKTIILVIEDHHDLRAYIRECLESTYKIIEAENGKQGIDKAFEVIPDLIISDIMMPEMDGLQVTVALKTDERTCHIPVILLTAKATTEEKIEGLETGADDYLLKPFHARELQVRIKNLIETRRRLQKRFKKITTLKPSEVAVNSLDEIFLEKILASIEKHIDDENYGVETLSDEIGLSPSQIYRKIIALTNQSTVQIIQSVRLDRAASLLARKSGDISRIAYNVGFSSPAYFSKCFREKFGCTPQAYIKKEI